MSLLVELGKNKRNNRSQSKPSLSRLMNQLETKQINNPKLNCHKFCLIEKQSSNQQKQFDKFSLILKNKNPQCKFPFKTNPIQKSNLMSPKYGSFSKLITQTKIGRVKSSQNLYVPNTIFQADVQQSLEVNYLKQKMYDQEQINLLDQLEPVISYGQFEPNKHYETTKSRSNRKQTNYPQTTPSPHQQYPSQNSNNIVQQQPILVKQFQPISPITLDKISGAARSQIVYQPKQKVVRSVTPDRQGKITKLRCTVKQFRPVSIIRQSPSQSNLLLTPNTITNISEKAIKNSILNLIKSTKIQSDCEVGIKGKITIQLKQNDPYCLFTEISNNINCKLLNKQQNTKQSSLYPHDINKAQIINNK